MAATEFGNFQKGILSDLTHSALYVTVFLKDSFMNNTSASNEHEVVRKAVGNFPNLVADVGKTHLGATNENDRDKAGLIGIIGIGPQLTRKWLKNPPELLKDYVEIRGKEEYSRFPATGGDIFLHLKSNRRDLSFIVAKTFIDQLQKVNAVERVEEVSGYSYLVDAHGMAKDMTGFEDGTKNPKTLSAKLNAAVIPKHGGSFLLTQRWIHDLNNFNRLNEKDQEYVIGRTKKDSEKLPDRPDSSHVSVTELHNEKGTKIEILRHSMPYGTATEHGLFFLAYSSDPMKIDIMLRKMASASSINPRLDLMKYSKAVSGQYFYIPNNEELSQFSGPRSKL